MYLVLKVESNQHNIESDVNKICHKIANIFQILIGILPKFRKQTSNVSMYLFSTVHTYNILRK